MQERHDRSRQILRAGSFTHSNRRNYHLSNVYIYIYIYIRLGNLTSKQYKAFINLAENDNLIVQKADKGNNVVILNRQDYIEKMLEILSDKN